MADRICAAIYNAHGATRAGGAGFTAGDMQRERRPASQLLNLGAGED